MNYLPLAAKNGAEIFTQTKVEWIEKLLDGRLADPREACLTAFDSDSFTLDTAKCDSLRRVDQFHRDTAAFRDARLEGFSRARNRFQRQRRFLRPFLQRRRRRPMSSATASVSRLLPGRAAPGPSIVAIVRYKSSGPVEKRIAIEDFSFPSAYVAGRQAGVRRHTRRRHPDRRRGGTEPAGPRGPQCGPAVRQRWRDEPHHAVPGDGD